MACDQSFLKIFSLITGLLGTACIVLAIVFWVQVGDFALGVASYSVFGPLVIGVFLFIAAICGFFGAKMRNKILLGIYFILMLVLTLALAAAGFLLLVYGGYISIPEADAIIDDFQESIYETCCADTSFASESIPLCADNSTADPCIGTRFEILEQACDALADTTLPGASAPLVGPEGDGGCGGGAGYSGFEAGIEAFISQNFLVIGIVVLVLVVLLLLVLICSCCVFCKKGDEYDGQVSA